MKFSIAQKIMVITIVGVVVACAAVLCVSAVLLNEVFQEQHINALRSMQGVIQRMRDDEAAEMLKKAVLLGRTAELAEAFAAEDKTATKKILKTVQEDMDLDGITLTDAKGRIFIRSHADRTGDDGSRRPDVIQALKGTAKSGMMYSEGGEIPFSCRGTAPLYRNGSVIGTVSLILNLGKESFVDSVKDLSGMEVTIFKNDVRFMTSIKGPDGKRIIGTKLNNPPVEDTVFKQGKTFIGKAKILGIPYNTAYWPLKDFEGKTVGIWFIGNSTAQLAKTENREIFIISACSIGIAIFLALCAAMVGKRIARPLRRATDYAVRVADGDLDTPAVDVKSNDEVGLLASALSRMVNTLKERISEAENVSRQAKKQAENAESAKLAAEAAGEETRKKQENILAAALRLEDAIGIIKLASTGLADRIGMAEKGAVQQAAHVADSAGAITEMSCSAQEVAGNATNAKNFSDQMKEKASEGESIVKDVLSDINAVQKNSLSLKQDMLVLDEHAKSISNIMGVISDIADQTNLLALNAAIEAARAGDAGRGFAVVADEVRKLAEKTMASTGEVGAAVDAIRKSMDKSMAQVDTTVSNIERTTHTATKSGEALREIVNMADDTAKQVGSIVTACEQQSSAMEEISHGISNVNALADQAVEAMKEAAHDVTSLAGQTDSLGMLVDEMKRG
ncbi:MAG: methyl-accepting chemotaxis protein [Betaproteobacteria bacterium]|nr:methyl-accepting chemotaxis protein [Betaproteobacteria bacterium]